MDATVESLHCTMETYRVLSVYTRILKNNLNDNKI